MTPAKTGTSATPTAPFQGALIPFNPKAPVDVVMLHQRLRYGGPEVTDEERIAIAHRLERYAALEAPGDDVDAKKHEEFRKNMRSVLRDDLRRFCIAWPPAGEVATCASRFFARPQYGSAYTRRPCPLQPKRAHAWPLQPHLRLRPASR
jgi:hypothetical protein